MKKQVEEAVYKITLHSKIVKKQRLYAQMLKDGITSKEVKDRVVGEINTLTEKLYARPAR